MKSAKEISLYDAIRQMRILSAEERPFSFAHFTRAMTGRKPTD